MRAVRRSPVKFEARPLETEDRNGWHAVLSYADEGTGPCLIDLSHRRRWDFQDRAVADHRPLGLDVPRRPGEAALRGDMMVNRMNPTQVAIWHLGPGPAPDTPDDVSFTDVTDSQCMLALVGDAPAHEGRGVSDVLERVSGLDLFAPGRPTPFLTQGPILHVPCQIVTGGPDCVLVTLSRGYGQTFADALLHAAADCGLRPGGEEVFMRWLANRPRDG